MDIAVAYACVKGIQMNVFQSPGVDIIKPGGFSNKGLFLLGGPFVWGEGLQAKKASVIPIILQCEGWERV